MGIEDSEVNKLYIRLPVKRREVDEFIIRDLHPNIVEVHLPRQKSGNWCIVDFENTEKLNEALPILKKKKIENKFIKIKLYKQGNPFDQGDWGPDDFDVDDDWISFNNEAGREFGFIIPDVMNINEDDDNEYSVGSSDEFEEEVYLEVEEETDSNLALDEHEESHSPSVIYSMSEDDYDYIVEVDNPNESHSVSIYTMSEDEYDYSVDLDDSDESPSPSIDTISEDEDYDYNLVLDELEESNSPSRSFAEAALRHLKVAIVDKVNPYGKITADQSNLIKRSLVEELDKAISTSGGHVKVPTFKSWTYSGEIIRVVCDDDGSLSCLENVIARLKPWEDASLAVVSQDKLPKLTKASLWIPEDGTTTSDDPERVLLRLTAQNPDVAVARWCTFHREVKKDPNGHLFVFGIGDEDMDVLRKREMRLSYAFTSLTLKVRSNEVKGSSSEPGTSGTQQPKTATKTDASLVPLEGDDQMVVDERGRGGTEMTNSVPSSYED
ncbi:unnamed protein product [Diabrotica balteata]|uniref:DUF4780 domain-containing protein n=1 Tax=Diabrotica balteata TaxID=107213 RepID=A0A9N9T449_DIABA|nr:unnamed protein product [Diabrotica balteata]